MIVYFGIFAVSLAFCAIASSKKQTDRDRPQLFFFALSAIVLIVFLSLRDGLGTDYYPIYVDGFEHALRGEATRFEIGYDLLQRFVGLFSDSYYALFFVASLLTIGLTYLAIYRLSPNPVLSVFILMLGGFFFFSTNAVRQCIAEAIFLNALYYLFKKKPAQFVGLTLLASTFHTAALCYLPLYFFSKKQLSPKAMAILAILFVLGGSIAFQVAFQIAAFFSPQFAIYSRLEQYFTGDFDVTDFVYLLLGIGLWLYARKISRSDATITPQKREVNDIYSSILFMGLLFAILSLSAAIMFRIVRLFTPVLILAIPIFMQDLKGKKWSTAIIVGIVVFFLASSIFLYGYLNFDTVIPYKTLFG